jgi:hypothetical protein
VKRWKRTVSFLNINTSPSAKIKKKKGTRGQKVTNKDHAVRSVDDWYYASFHLSSTNKKFLWIVL